MSGSNHLLHRSHLVASFSILGDREHCIDLDLCGNIMQTILGVKIHFIFIRDVLMMVFSGVEVSVLVEVEKYQQPVLFSLPSSLVDPQCVAELALKDVRKKGGTDCKVEFWVFCRGMSNT